MIMGIGLSFSIKQLSIIDPGPGKPEIDSVIDRGTMVDSCDIAELSSYIA